ncbi:hypothetical protein [Chitinophaga sp. Cy-1792]|uniref:hypothetical protein n=1 Tax=Chitinophaga sp. Cy-1792 TaxID=2608339 RepID=UPI00196691A4|nr:hypothetical protein [Chitinophaga sp. Cy-1792]
MKELKKRQWEIYIYTTSYRKPRYIRQLFLSYGIGINKIINKAIHDKTLGTMGGNISKYPPAFNINIHVDDSPGVAMEGERHDFKTLIIAEEDQDWTNTVLDHLNKTFPAK